MSFASSERTRIAHLLHELGPQAPTLCEGWDTHDMAAHLWLREHRPDAVAGMFIPVLASHLEKVTAKVKARDYDQLVDDWAAGAPKFSPLSLADAQLNLAEHFVHHEDIRRANGDTSPREFSLAVRKKFHGILKLFAPRLLARSDKPVILIPTGSFERIVCADKRGVSADGGAVVRVHGEVAELLLWVYGRDAAVVEIVGDTQAIHRRGI